MRDGRSIHPNTAYWAKNFPLTLHFCLTFVIKLGIITKMLAMANNLTSEIFMNLTQAQTGKQYVVSNIQTDDQQLDAFLFSLGCYSGQPITVVSRQKSNCIVLIKQARYSIDNQLAKAIIV